jgi:hypothetical protein
VRSDNCSNKMGARKSKEKNSSKIKLEKEIFFGFYNESSRVVHVKRLAVEALGEFVYGFELLV